MLDWHLEESLEDHRFSGFNERFELDLKLLCQNAIVSETLALPSSVLLAIVAYAVVAAVFYNSDS